MDAFLTLIVLGLTVLLLITEWVPPGVTGLAAMVALIVTGVLPAEVAFAGLINPAVLTVAAMYVISAAVERTGAAAAVVDKLAHPTRVSPRVAFLLVLGATMLLSGFVNNTPLILILLPLVMGLASRMQEAPSRLLIPLSYVSILGGSATLIGTSTNLIVASSLREVSGGQFALRMFDFTRLGFVLALAGGLFVWLARRRLLPERPALGLLTQRGVAVEYMTEITVQADDGFDQRTLGELKENGRLDPNLRVLEVVRDEVIRIPDAALRLRAGDLVLVKGTPETILELRLAEEQRARESKRSDAVRGVGLTLFELVITPDSPWSGRRVENLRLRQNFDASLFAVQRRSAHMREKLERLKLLPGDVLLIQGTERSMQCLRETQGVLVVEGVNQVARHTRGAPRVALALATFVVLSVSGLVAIEVAALLAALFTVVSGTLSAQRAYQSIGWDVLLVIAGTLALGAACVHTGLAEAAARQVMAIAAPLGLRALLAVVLVVTALLTQVLSNNATAAMMTPIAFQLGNALDAADPLPFVMAVAFGANCSFLTPVSYNTNLIVYGPGGYRFGDFLRLGLPLTVLHLAIATALLPLLY